VSDFAVERNKFKELFSNTTSRILLGVWVLVKGSRFPLKSIIEILSMTEDALESKLQTFAGMGLVHVTTTPRGEREIEFLPAPTIELERQILEFFAGRKNEFSSIELKIHALLYKTILTSTL
jgi:hypothetical protein